MAFINVFIESQCGISVENDALILKTDDRRAVYPIEDINCVMIDCLYDRISVYALNKLCENGATVIVCDDRHLPSSVLLPFNKYYKKLSVLDVQMSVAKPKLKNLWKNIIKQKIINQAECLDYNRLFGGEYLFALSKNVLSGDSENAEARAAAFYFKNLFGAGFSRNDGNINNIFLNYCYAVVRALIARHLSARGFECSIGIFHKNQLNNFNLADDMIEPFRPIIDNFVFNECSAETDFNSEIKKRLFGIVNLNVVSGNEVHSLSNAVERLVKSLLSVYNGTAEDLIMPKICDLSMHDYE